MQEQTAGLDATNIMILRHFSGWCIRQYISADRTVPNRQTYSENYYLNIILGFSVNEL
jgi:hypothetical protein